MGRVQKGTCHDQGSIYRYNHRPARSRFVVRREDKSYTGCVEYLDDTDAVNLPNNSKIVYIGHRRFLPKDHPYRRNKKDFNGTIEKRLAPKYQDGPAILREVNKLEVVLGKGHNEVAAPDGSVWKKKNDFLETTLLAISECMPLS